MQYPFFLYREKPGAKFDFSPEGRFPFGRMVGNDWPSVETLGRCAAIGESELEAALDCDPLLEKLSCVDKALKSRWGDVRKDGRSPVETLGATVKMPIEERDRLFAALLGVAQRHGFSLADPLFGVLWATPAEEARRGGIWLRSRRSWLMDDLQRRGHRRFFALLRAEAEAFYIVEDGGKRCGKPKAEKAASFREHLARALWPGERLVPFPGRLIVEGLGGSYRFHFNWEGNGKHARFTADFRESECPIAELGRSSIHMLRRTPSRRSLVDVGMEHPAVVELVPDPAERYTMLYFANRKLRKRLPKALVEELQATMAAGTIASDREKAP